MVKFRLSAFSDEYSPEFDKQIEGLLLNKIHMTELRNIDGTNVSDLTAEQAKEVRRKLDAAGLSVSAIGSPIGKIKITDPMDEHLDKLRNTCEVASIVGTKRIRMFSFYIEDGKYAESQNEVVDRMGQMLDVAEEYKMELIHENEKGIYGDIGERCLELMQIFDGRLGCVFDPCNFIQCGSKPFPDCYNMLKPYITYMHIKDCGPHGIVPAGRGTGCLPETLAMINLTHTGDFILTLEPHLRIFDGFDKLEGDHRQELSNSYATSAEAFEAAVTNLRYCIPKTAECL